MAKVENSDSLINCLRNERVTVRFVPKANGKITDPKHVLYGGMAETASRTFFVPKLNSGRYTNVLTKDEMKFLENLLGMEEGDLSIYKTKDNFWDYNNPNGIASVRLTKDDNYFDLSNPRDYIKYKILLANKDYICPSLEELNRFKKATYQYVILNPHDEDKAVQDKMTLTMKCYKEFGKIEDNFDKLKFVVDTYMNKINSESSKIEFLQARANEAIQTDARKFYNIVTDQYLDTKVLLRKCVKNGSVTIRGNYYYVSETNTPLCEDKENPTLEVAAKFLNSPKNQDLKILLEAKLNA